MTTALKIAIAGSGGRMGQAIADLSAHSKDIQVVGAVEAPDHPWIGKGLVNYPEVIVTADPRHAFANAQAVIDFSVPAAAAAHARLAADMGKCLVIGVTGFSTEQQQHLQDAATRTALVHSGNMALGVNVLAALTRKVAALLDETFDIEIVEIHHRHKVDAPSGTALMLGAAAAQGRQRPFDRVADHRRAGSGARKPGHIGLAALRGGDVVGEHDVVFAGPGERLVLRHVATDRSIFARGAVHAARWGQHQPPGLYSMLDVLGIHL